MNTGGLWKYFIHIVASRLTHPQPHRRQARQAQHVHRPRQVAVQELHRYQIEHNAHRARQVVLRLAGRRARDGRTSHLRHAWPRASGPAPARSGASRRTAAAPRPGRAASPAAYSPCPGCARRSPCGSASCPASSATCGSASGPAVLAAGRTRRRGPRPAWPAASECRPGRFAGRRPSSPARRRCDQSMPARSAGVWPKLRRRRTTLTRGSAAASSSSTAKEPSMLPSSTKRIS